MQEANIPGNARDRAEAGKEPRGNLDQGPLVWALLPGTEWIIVGGVQCYCVAAVLGLVIAVFPYGVYLGIFPTKSEERHAGGQGVPHVFALYTTYSVVKVVSP